MSLINLHYRLKVNDRQRRELEAMAYSVNFVWNMNNNWSTKAWKESRRFLTAYDVSPLTSGVSKELKLHSNTIQAVNEEHFRRRKQFKKVKLRYRSTKRSLGWVPFKKEIKYSSRTFTYNGMKFRFWDSKYKHINLNEVKILSGSFNQDTKGNWFINVVVEISDVHSCVDLRNAVGIDLGLNELATTSDGVVVENKKFYGTQQGRLAAAQRAKKKKQIKSINTKIKNQRRDYLNKEISMLIKEYEFIVVGNLNLGASKSVNDASFGYFKTNLLSRAIRHGKRAILVNEAWTTQRCSACGELTGPKGLNGLSVREWVCSSCGKSHKRDTNAAINILRLGRQTLYPGIPCL
jgi:transposase